MFDIFLIVAKFATLSLNRKKKSLGSRVKTVELRVVIAPPATSLVIAFPDGVFSRSALLLLPMEGIVDNIPSLCRKANKSAFTVLNEKVDTPRFRSPSTLGLK